MKNPLDALRRFLFGRASPYDAQTTRAVSLGSTTSGTYVRDDLDALSYTGVWACVRVIAETVAGLPWQVYRAGATTRTYLPAHPVNRLLNTKPNPEMGSFTFRETMLVWANLWGYSIAEIERDAMGRPAALWPIEPHRVELDRDASKQLWYRVRNYGAEDTYLSPDDVFHLRGFGPAGLHGYYVIALFREAVGLGLATEQQAAAFFGNSSVPGGFLKHPGKIGLDEAKDLIATFELRHGGPRRRKNVGILQGGLEYEAAATTNEDAELTETRTFQILEACRIFRVPPHKVAELTRATYSNIAEQETAFGRDTIAPWATRLEQEANAKLFPERASTLFYSKIALNAIMRGDPEARGRYYEIMQRIGGLTVNEIRSLEELDAIGPEGDKILVTRNLTTIENVDKDHTPEPPPEKVEEEAEEKNEGEEEGEGQAKKGNRAIRPLVLDLLSWFARKTRGEVASAMVREGSRGTYAGWLKKWAVDAGAVLAGRLQPLSLTYAEIYDLPPELVRDQAVEIAREIVGMVERILAPGDREAVAAMGPQWVQRSTDWALTKFDDTRECQHGQAQ